MTPTSNERREMAEQLRKHNGRYYEELVNMSDSDLADLIDPCPSMADEQMGKLRRRSTALASMTRIASDMSGWAGELADSRERMSRARIADDVKRFAERIRQEVRDALN